MIKEKLKRGSILYKLYLYFNIFIRYKILKANRKTHSQFGEDLFIESFFFPVPPDLMIIPMVVAKREDYFKIFLIATVFSVLGGLFGYFLGVFFLDLSMVVIEFYGYEEKVFEVQDNMSSKEGFFLWLGIMFLAGFTPLPFKVFTITSGIINFNIFIFFFICLFTRGLRFFLVAYLTSLFGNKFGKFIEKKGALWFTISGIIIVIIATILYQIFK